MVSLQGETPGAGSLVVAVRLDGLGPLTLSKTHTAKLNVNDLMLDLVIYKKMSLVYRGIV